jgi:hypothetical protein
MVAAGSSDMLIWHYVASRPRRQQSSQSKSQEPQIKTFSLSRRSLFHGVRSDLLHQVQQVMAYGCVRKEKMRGRRNRWGNLLQCKLQKKIISLLYSCYWTIHFAKSLTCFNSMRIIQPSGLAHVRDATQKNAILFPSVCQCSLHEQPHSSPYWHVVATTVAAAG